MGFLFLVLFLNQINCSAKEITWNLLSKYDLKTKKVGKELSSFLKKKRTVTLLGFMIPLEFSKKTVKEFLLVPYFPSCIHVPPPPQNQIVLVKSKKKITPSYYPVKVKGRLRLTKEKKSNGFISSGAFEMEGKEVKEIKS